MNIPLELEFKIKLIERKWNLCVTEEQKLSILLTLLNENFFLQTELTELAKAKKGISLPPLPPPPPPPPPLGSPCWGISVELLGWTFAIYRS